MLKALVRVLYAVGIFCLIRNGVLAEQKKCDKTHKDSATCKGVDTYCQGVASTSQGLSCVAEEIILTQNPTWDVVSGGDAIVNSSVPTIDQTCYSTQECVSEELLDHKYNSHEGSAECIQFLGESCYRCKTRGQASTDSVTLVNYTLSCSHPVDP